MKLFVLSHLNIVYVLVLLTLSSASWASDKTIRLGYSSAEAYPYQINHEVNPPGIAFDILNSAFKDLKMEIEYVRLPNKRVQISLSSGDIDGAFMYSFLGSREVNGRYPMKDGKLDKSKRLTTLSYYLYKLKRNPLSWDGKEFSGVDLTNKSNILGANFGYSIASHLNKMGINVDEGSLTTEQNFKKLFIKRISGYAQQDLVADHYLKKHKINTVTKLPLPLATKPYFLMFSHQFVKQNPNMAEEVWNKIAEIRDKVTQDIAPKYSN